MLLAAPKTPPSALACSSARITSKKEGICVRIVVEDNWKCHEFASFTSQADMEARSSGYETRTSYWLVHGTLGGGGAG